jgi:hypothetical protein
MQESESKGAIEARGSPIDAKRFIQLHWEKIIVDPNHQATRPSLFKKIDVAQRLKVMDIEKEIKIQC